MNLWSPSIEEKFTAWMRTPDGIHAYDNVRTRAFRLKERGWRHFGIKALWEAARYDRALELGPDVDGFKLNNNYSSRMARLLMDNEPGLRGFFSLRELRS